MGTLQHKARPDKRDGEILFVTDILDKHQAGWLSAEVEGLGSRSLCYGTQVRLLDRTQHEEIVLIREGPFKGQRTRIPFQSISRYSNTSYLSNKIAVKPAGIVTCKISEKRLYVPQIGGVKVHLDSRTISPGVYYILIPEYPHESITKEEYRTEPDGSRFANTWFRFTQNSYLRTSQFIHFGRFSEGCITVEFNKSISAGKLWTQIYFSLISCRLDDTYIGQLKIVA